MRRLNSPHHSAHGGTDSNADVTAACALAHTRHLTPAFFNVSTPRAESLSPRPRDKGEAYAEESRSADEASGQAPQEEGCGRHHLRRPLSRLGGRGTRSAGAGENLPGDLVASRHDRGSARTRRAPIAEQLRAVEPGEGVCLR